MINYETDWYPCNAIDVDEFPFLPYCHLLIYKTDSGTLSKTFKLLFHHAWVLEAQGRYLNWINKFMHAVWIKKGTQSLTPVIKTF